MAPLCRADRGLFHRHLGDPRHLRAWQEQLDAGGGMLLRAAFVKDANGQRFGARVCKEHVDFEQVLKETRRWVGVAVALFFLLCPGLHHRCLFLNVELVPQVDVAVLVGQEDPQDTELVDLIHVVVLCCLFDAKLNV